MAVYFVTGKLGAGKSLMTVNIIKGYLVEDRPVATNLDLNLPYLIGKKSRKCRVFRIPDRPCSVDLWAIGKGNKTKDETQNGALVLDECGVWFNTRNWNDKGRQDVINFLLMARKQGWDVYIIVQNIAMIDKQARDGIAEYVAYCTRLDRVSIPLVSFLFKMVTGKRLPLPKLHTATVKLGTRIDGPKSETWTLWGTSLYSAYNTQQIFKQDSKDEAVYSYLPPAYLYRKPKPLTLVKIMRLTRIYLRRFRRVPLVVFGAFAGMLISSYISLVDLIDKDAMTSGAEPITHQFKGYEIIGTSQFPNVPTKYRISNGDVEYSDTQLIAKGVVIHAHSRCEVTITDKEGSSPVKLLCKEV